MAPFKEFVNNVAFDAQGDLNYNMNFLSRQALLSAILGVSVNESKFMDYDTSNNAYVNRVVGMYYGVPDNLVAELLFNNVTSTSFLDTTNSTCLYSERGLVAFCDVLDHFDDASFNTAIWSKTETNGTVVEASGYIALTRTANNADVSIISDQASGLNVHGQNTEVLVDFDYDLSTGGSTTSANIFIQLSNGTTHVSLFSETVASTGESASGSGVLRFVYDHANTRCDVWVRYYEPPVDSTGSPDMTPTVLGAETLVAGNVDVSSVTTNKYLRCLVTTGGNTSTAVLNVYAVGYRKNGAGAANADLVVNQTFLSSSSRAIFEGLWASKPAANPTAVFSTDGTTTYGSDDCWAAWGDAPGAGTSMKARIRVAKPTTITADTINIPVLSAYGCFYD